MRNKTNTKDFKKLIEKVIKINDMLYNKIIKQQYETLHKKSKIYVKKNIVNKKKSHFKSEKTFLIKIIFIKLNAITRRKKTNFKIKRNNINKKACYEYNKLNYFARNC